MAELQGIGLTTHLDAILQEFQSHRSIYGYPERKFYLGFPGHDFSVDFHDRKAATPLGPASGPHTQMAQNIVLSFLGGGRIMELKTVQIRDRLKIPRPCIDIRNIGFNVEWSQELLLEDSYREYITAWILLKIIAEMALLGIPKGDSFYDTVFDISLGYDLKGIASPPVQRWLNGMKDASGTIAEMLAQLPDRYARFRSLNIPSEVSNSATLSTFHGCPREEIEAIMQYLIAEHHLHAIIKFNPTILGYDFVAKTLREKLGYADIELDPVAFESDLKFDEAVAMMQRLRKFASKHHRNVGAKFTNTLVVKNNQRVFEDETMYLSGPPLHVLAMFAMQRFRDTLGADILTSFSAGIDKHNFADTVSCNIKPVSVCTDLLKTGGYTRMFGYLKDLKNQMAVVESRNIDQFIRQKAGVDQATSVPAAGMTNSENLVANLAANPRYFFANNRKIPPKIDSYLQLFDCIICDKCLPVCPNAANFSIPTGTANLAITDYRIEGDDLEPVSGGFFVLEKARQIANLADFCNECGDCDTYCPEDGGPFIEKPRFFFSKVSYDSQPAYDGFYLSGPNALTGRINGTEYHVSRHLRKKTWCFISPQAELLLDEKNNLITAKIRNNRPQHEHIAMKPYHIMKTLLLGLNATSKTFPAILLFGNDSQQA